MFEQKKAVFFYTVSPVHMGAGQALGMVDNPIQREVHTKHPVFAGSGIKGAFRHEAKPRGIAPVDVVFGPESDSGDLHAGAVSFTDAQVLLFPVRSLKKGFLYVTCPLAIARAARLLSIAGNNGLEGFVNGLPDDLGTKIAMFDDSLKSGNKLILESFWFDQYSGNELLNFEDAVDWIADNALPADKGFKNFINKIKIDAVLVSNQIFTYFVNNSTIVEPHVRIDDKTGTAADGALFYTESLPPETLMFGLMMASKARKKGVKDDAAAMAQKVVTAFDKKVLQIGGDSTTGRGLVMVKFV